MNMPMKRSLFLLSLLVFVVSCGKGNVVDLTYALGQTKVPCVGEIVVFKLQDKRQDTTLGKEKDGNAIYAVSDVADWIGWAMFDELKNAGCDPKYRTSTLTSGEEPVVTGEVLAATLNQTGTTTYKGSLTVRIEVRKSDEVILAEKYTSEVEDAVLPGYGTKSEVMAEVLRGLMSEIIPAISAKVGH